MDDQSMDEVRRKRLNRLAGNTEDLGSVPDDNSISNSTTEKRDLSDVEMTEQSEMVMSCKQTGHSKEAICESSMMPKSQDRTTIENTGDDLVPASSLHDKLVSHLSRILSVQFQEEPQHCALITESENNIAIYINDIAKHCVPDNPLDIRYYKSLCYDILSSAIFRILTTCSAVVGGTVGKNAVNYFLIEYLSICMYQVKIEKAHLCSSKSDDPVKQFTFEVLDEIECQIYRHVLLVLTGVFSTPSSEGPSHVPGDPWLHDKLTDSALLRLVVPWVLPSNYSLWTLAMAATYNQSLADVGVPGRLEPPAGSDEVLFQLLGKLQRELESDSHTPGSQSLRKIFEQLLMSLYCHIRRFSLDEPEFGHILSALVNLCNSCLVDGDRPIIQLLVRLPCWSAPALAESAEITGRSVELLSFLGPFLSASVFADDDHNVVVRKFPTSGENESSRQALQLDLDLVWNQQFTLIKCLLSKSTRSETLVYLCEALKRNADHSKLHCDTRFLAGEGFMFNISLLFQRLALPINLDSVDPRYLFHSDCRLNLSDTTRINADSEDVLRFQQRLETELNASGGGGKPTWNFSTECFFLTAWSLHLGLQTSIRKYAQRQQLIASMTRTAELMDANLAQSNDPQDAANSVSARYKRSLELQRRAKICSETVLFYHKPLQAFAGYYASLSKLLLRIGACQDSSGLSTQEKCPDMFAMLPEYFLDDIANYLVFVLKNIHVSMLPFDTNSRSALVTLVLFVICHAHFVRNPYLVAKFVEVLFFCDPAVTRVANTFHEATKMHSLSTTHLIGALIRLYINVESTGFTNEFYDKFSIRYNISTIFITWWNEGFLKNLFIQEAETRQQDFIKFTNRVLNDMSFLLEESLDSLKKIRELQDRQDDAATWSTLPRDQQDAVTNELASHEQRVRSYLTLANQTVNLLSHLTSGIQTPFLRPEIVDKLAAMLNFNLVQLCGPRCSSLKVRNPDSYGWAPKKLLAQLVSIYRHLDTSTGEFAAALAKDERCYSKELFAQATALMSMRGIQTDDELRAFSQLGEKVEEIRRMHQEVDYGDIPSEFCDTLIATLMDDPVMLPQSQAVVDRSTIMRHLLNQETDPFCRLPLKEEDLIPLPELRSRIQAWKAEREAEWRAKQGEQ